MIESAEVFYQADDPHVTLKLGLDADDLDNASDDDGSYRFYRFLSGGAYKRLRQSILSIECEICGGNHPDIMHGGVVLTLDTGRDTVEDTLLRQLQELKSLFDNESERQYYNTMQEVLEKFLIDRLAIEQKGLEIGDRTSDTVSWELDYDWYDRKMDDIAGEAGYVIYNNSDAGAWMVYAAYSDDEHPA